MLTRTTIALLLVITKLPAPTWLEVKELHEMINPQHSSRLVGMVLEQMQKSLPGNGWDSPEARDMISLVFAQESKWRELYQVVKGDEPGTARGVGQIEPATALSLLTRTAHKKYPDYRKQIHIFIMVTTGTDVLSLIKDEEYLKFQLMSNIALNMRLGWAA